MVSLKVTVPSGEITSRLRDRLRGNAVTTATKVVWQRPDGQRLLLYLDATFKAKLLDGWIFCQLDAQTDQTARQTLQFAFFVGRPLDGDSVQAAASLKAVTPGAAQIAAVFGPDLQRVLWDAVLDALEAMVFEAAKKAPGQPLTLKGYTCNSDVLSAEVITGAF